MVILYRMKRPIYVRPLTDAERQTLEAGLRSPDAFTLRRCQIFLLASDAGQNAYQIARNLGCNPQTARNAIHKFSTRRAFPRRLGGALTARTPFIGPSMRRAPRRLCARCFTIAPESSANQAACGRWRWPP